MAWEDAERRRASLDNAVKRVAAEIGVVPEIDVLTAFVSPATEELQAASASADAQTKEAREVNDRLMRLSDELASAEARLSIEQERLNEVIRRGDMRSQQLALLGLPAAASRADIDGMFLIAQERQTPVARTCDDAFGARRYHKLQHRKRLGRS